VKNNDSLDERIEEGNKQIEELTDRIINREFVFEEECATSDKDMY
jgi:peptidoglycan hydrolase CwlO-like protein